jgi:hypothetical protein
MKSAVKLPLVQDVEDRILAETDELSLLKLQFMEKLDEVAATSRRVKFSELLYDESANLIKYIHSAFSSEPNMQDIRAKIQSIYRFRIQQAHKATIHEPGDTLSILHGEIIGNILSLYSHNRDLLYPFYNRGLPGSARKSIWKGLLLYPEAEREYEDLYTNSRISTISRNEVEITKKAVEVFSQFCPSLAFDSKIINQVRVVLSYLECVYQRLLPDFQYYLQMPVFYILNELGINMPKLVGVCLKMTEIQNTVWPDNPSESITDIFLNTLYKLDSDLYNLLTNLIDIRNTLSRERLENFLKPFLARLTSGYLNIEVTCMIYDQFLIVNSNHKIYYILAIILMIIKPRLLTAATWDEFLATFYGECRKITVEEMEPLMDKIPLLEKIDGKRYVPDSYVGQDYLNYIQNAKENAAFVAVGSIVHEGGTNIQGILAKTGEEGIKTKQVLKGNWYDVMLNYDIKKFIQQNQNKQQDKKGAVATNQDILGLQNYSKDIKAAALLSLITNPESLKNNIKLASQPHESNSPYDQFSNPRFSQDSKNSLTLRPTESISPNNQYPSSFNPLLSPPNTSPPPQKPVPGSINLNNPSIKHAEQRLPLPPDAGYLKGGLVPIPLNKRLKPRYYESLNDKLR